MRKVRIGARGSRLALWQADWVQRKIQEHDPACAVEIQIIKTTGDRITDVPLGAIGVKGLFTKEIEAALLDRRVDLAVHSLKDLPTDLPPGLRLVAISEREVPYDAWVSRTPGLGLAALPAGAAVGTSSLRRRCQLCHRWPGLRVVDLRGNVDTRLRKLDAGGLDGVVLAAAGLRRLGLAARITEVLPPAVMVPAIGQGALALEARADDTALQTQLAFLHSPATALATAAERAFLHRLGGGCAVPIAAYATVDGAQLSITGLVGAPDGSELVRDTQHGAAADPEAAGVALAERLLQAGAERLLNAFYKKS